MRVKVGKRIYNSDKLPIMVVLSDEEKGLISGMAPVAHKFAVFPHDTAMTEDEAREWMKLPDEPHRSPVIG